MNFKLVFRIIAVLLIVVSLFMLLPSFVAVYYNELNELKCFIITIVFITVISLITLAFCRKEAKKILSIKEGFLLVALSWTCASFFGAIPFYISGSMPASSPAAAI